MRALLLLLFAALTACAGSSALRERADLREDSPGELAQYQLDKRVAPGERTIDPARYRAASAHAATMRRYSAKTGRFVDGGDAAKATAPQWESLGPGNVAGRARTLEFDPRDPNHVYAAGVSGGVWESFDGGESWSTRSDAAANLNIGSLAIDPVEPDTIYAGTGELYRNNDQPVSSMWGQGILRSSDGGRTFQQLSATANDDFRYVADLAISPHDHDRIYAATNSGIWRSNDRGISFARVLRPQDPSGSALYEGCNDLLFPAGHDGDYLLAACASRSTDDRYYLPGTVLPPACAGPCPAAIFLNTDAAGAGAWQQVLTEPAMGRTTMDFARSRPDTIYAVSASIVPGFDRDRDGLGDYNNGLDAVWRSTDGGRTWQARVRNSSSDALSTYLLSYAETIEYALCRAEKFIYGAGWYNQAIAVDPTNPDRVWVAGMDQYRSDDGGASFGKASYWFDFGTGNPDGIHADQHLLKFHPRYDGVAEKRLYATNDGGIAVTDDATAPVSRGAMAACDATNGQVAWRTLTHDLATAQFYTGGVTPDGSLWLGGAQDNGTLLNNPARAHDAWRHIYGGDGGYVAIDPRNANVIYASAQNISLGRSVTGGSGFVDATAGLNDFTVFTMPYLLDPSAPDRLYAGGTRVWRTENQGRNWLAASAPFGTSAYANRISALAIAPTDPDHMLAGNQVAIFSSRAATTSTATTAWNRVAPRAGWVSSLIFDPHDANVAYATYSSFGGAHVWRSADAGLSWTPIDGGGDGALPDVPVHTLAIDPGDAGRLFIGTDIGVFASIDGGAHWAVENSGFANVITESLVMANGTATVAPQLFAFTYGRGAWRVPLSQLSGTADYRIGADTSGSFFDPAQDGHGWIVDAITTDGVTSVIAAWYVYVDGEQRWLIGTGPATANEARVPLYIASGGAFPPAFDPAQVNLQPWGEAVLRFDDRDHGSASWTTHVAGFADGSMPLARLTRPAQAAGESPVARVAACHSGTWYNAQQSGHGLMVEVLGEPDARQLLAIWYTYLDGSQRWLIGTGPVTGDHADVAMLITRGGRFPPAFNAASVVREPWGTLTFRAIDGDHAHIDWNSSYAGFNDGSLDLVRLTAQLGRACP